MNAPTPPFVTPERWKWLTAQCRAMDAQANRGTRPKKDTR